MALTQDQRRARRFETQMERMGNVMEQMGHDIEHQAGGFTGNIANGPQNMASASSYRGNYTIIQNGAGYTGSYGGQYPGRPHWHKSHPVGPSDGQQASANFMNPPWGPLPGPKSHGRGMRRKQKRIVNNGGPPWLGNTGPFASGSVNEAMNMVTNMFPWPFGHNPFGDDMDGYGDVEDFEDDGPGPNRRSRGRPMQFMRQAPAAESEDDIPPRFTRPKGKGKRNILASTSDDNLSARGHILDPGCTTYAEELQGRRRRRRV